MTDQEKIAALELELIKAREDVVVAHGIVRGFEAERDALAALVAEKDAALWSLRPYIKGEKTREIGTVGLVHDLDNAICKSHPSVERARLVAEVVDAADLTARSGPLYKNYQAQVDAACFKEMVDALVRLAAYDAKP